MEYMAVVFQGLGELLVKMWSYDFVFLGVQTSVCACIIYSGIVALVVKLIRG